MFAAISSAARTGVGAEAGPQTIHNKSKGRQDMNRDYLDWVRSVQPAALQEQTSGWVRDYISSDTTYKIAAFQQQAEEQHSVLSRLRKMLQG